MRRINLTSQLLPFLQRRAEVAQAWLLLEAITVFSGHKALRHLPLVFVARIEPHDKVQRYLAFGHGREPKHVEAVVRLMPDELQPLARRVQSVVELAYRLDGNTVAGERGPL